ncbi:syntaxin binding protein 6 (amisyn), like [Chanos chanos]|uniref:Syntaxin binding protein 6 (Amisyn), like n=1 Tax=Chanos chanos TaxID=29144 RepID=A0A6J2V4F4_CHACN|nr:syntaxin-binding protein 6-like [Chanos chanos]
MNIQSAINREIFAPRDERMLVAIEVRRRRKRRLPFVAPERKGNYVTYLCLSVTNKKPAQVFITKVKQFEGSPRFVKRSQWSVEQLRQVNGINPNKDSPEFDLLLNHTSDQWIASSAAEKCMFVQILYHACQNYWESKQSQGSPRLLRDQKDQGLSESQKPNKPQCPTEFVNCQSKLMGDACSVNMAIYRCKIFLNRMKNTVMSQQGRQLAEAKPAPAKASGSSPSPPAGRNMGNVVRRASHMVSEHGERLGRAEEKTAIMMLSARQLAETAQRLALKQIN